MHNKNFTSKTSYCAFHNSPVVEVLTQPDFNGHQDLNQKEQQVIASLLAVNTLQRRGFISNSGCPAEHPEQPEMGQTLAALKSC
ncbi:MAG TPA: hypothetical protein VL093_03495 [Flavipsychrobacter sp.]|nr:hypothetical protein [Flavipsychrobacter sp.]